MVLTGVRVRGRSRSPGTRTTAVLAAAALVAALLPLMATPAEALPNGFTESVAFDGLSVPTAVAFSPGDDRVFVAEKRGVVRVFDSLTDSSPTTFADLRTQVYNADDRGLLGLALHPDFPTDPRVYVLYTHDAEIGGEAPRWGAPDTDVDPCPDPPGARDDGCVYSARLSVLTADGNQATGEQVLIEDWCGQFPTHSIGDLEFGPDGALYVSGGDGASFTFADYGQRGDPPNPCGDPPGDAGTALSPPTAEGGALRSQDLRTTGDPTGLDGTILRLDPETGAALPDNPAAASSDANTRRIIAYGLRNPFRFAVHPDSGELFIGDVGWNRAEEINRVADPTARVRNFGWPCYEADARQPDYDDAGLDLCEDLYADGPSAHDTPWFFYEHAAELVDGDGCGTGTSSASGVSFYPGGDYPARYDGALFYADFSRDCIWVMFPDGDGVPDPSTATPFVAPASNPVDLVHGPDGDLYYPDIANGRVMRVSFTGVDVPSDIAGTTHEDAILWAIDEGIAFGFTDGTYRPNDDVTRGQMASFLQRALDLPVPDEPPIPLTDIAGTTHDDAITAIAQAGITLGYPDGTYRPNDDVTRGQMASFLARALRDDT
jgi:glucose/arabinose dehydrogenase